MKKRKKTSFPHSLVVISGSRIAGECLRLFCDGCDKTGCGQRSRGVDNSDSRMKLMLEKTKEWTEKYKRRHRVRSVL